MTKHKLITSEVTINDRDLIDTNMSEQELTEYIKHELASGLVDQILENNIVTLLGNKDTVTMSTKFRISLMAVDPYDYEELLNAIVRNGFEIMKDGEIVPLTDLL